MAKMTAMWLVICLVGIVPGVLSDFGHGPLAWRWRGLHTVDELNLENYYGRWYEMYSNLLVKLTFERNSFCTTATYGEGENGIVTVFNSGRLNSPTGPPNEITGYAYVPDSADPGKLKLQFPNSPLGDYWVLALGPVVMNEYQWSVVSDPSMLTVFILARDPESFQSMYQEKVLALVEDMGFKRFWNRPRPTYQENDCLYPPPPLL